MNDSSDAFHRKMLADMEREMFEGGEQGVSNGLIGTQTTSETNEEEFEWIKRAIDSVQNQPSANIEPTVIRYRPEGEDILDTFKPLPFNWVIKEEEQPRHGILELESWPNQPDKGRLIIFTSKDEALLVNKEKTFMGIMDMSSPKDTMN